MLETRRRVTGRRVRPVFPFLAAAVAIFVWAVDAPATDLPGDAAADAPAITPGIDGVGTADQSQAGDPCSITLQNHDDSFENAYAWVTGGVAPPTWGAFAEPFVGSFEICEVQLFLTQTGNQAGQTMDVYVWRDDLTGRPGTVVASVLDVDPGPIATWPEVTRVDVPISAIVGGRWWVGWWGNWPGADAGWLAAADENGVDVGPRTRINAGLGFPAGWDHPNVVLSWANAKSLGIQVAGATILSADGAQVAPPVMLGSPRPNPFTASTSIAFDLDAGARVEVAVFDGSGRHVRRLADGAFGMGTHRLQWDGSTDAGDRVAPGVYFVRMLSGGQRDMRRLVLTR